jgi:hypothetical protein
MDTSLFPKSMLTNNAMSLDVIKAKLNYFELQLHELHWQTTNFAEHNALGDLYESVFTFKDEIIEKIMGYTGIRTKAMPVDPIKNYSPGLSLQVIRELMIFSKSLQDFGANNNMPDIENVAQSLNGTAAKTAYRLSLN